MGEPPAEPDTLRVLIGSDLAGHRADDAVLRSFPGFSRREVKALFEAGRVTSSGRRLKKGDRVTTGVELLVEAPLAPIRPDPTLPLEVLFESADFVIVDKPAGLPTAPLSRVETRSLAGALLARYPEMFGVGFREREPGLVHRLDNETSGVVLAARNQAAFERARSLFGSGQLEKRYLAVVTAEVRPAGDIETWLGPDPSDPRRVRAFDEAPDGYAKRCRTSFRVQERAHGFTLVELSVASAFRHQIRAHLAHLGCPIAGDALYGGASVPSLGERHALHGSYIAWAGDAGRAGFRAEAGLPVELRALLAGGAAGG